MIPFSIYDLLPFIFNDSSHVWEYFQEPPKRVWYSSIALLTMALTFNLMSATYFFKRDPIGLFDVLEPYWIKTGCQGDVFGRSLPSILCSQCDLKIGAGRIYFKFFLVFAWVVTMVVYLYSVNYILGMRYRDRRLFREGLNNVLTGQLSNLLINLQQNCSFKMLSEKCYLQLKKQENIFTRFGETNKGKKKCNFVRKLE